MQRPEQLRPIKHIWFDLEGTLNAPSPARDADHKNLVLKSYAAVVHKPVSDSLWNEYRRQYDEHGSNSAVFRSLGLPSDYWQKILLTLDESKYYKPDKRVTDTLMELKEHVPLSIFTNVTLEKILTTLTIIGIDKDWFTFLLTGDDIAERKPELDGFYKIIELTKLPAGNILYVGDRIKADILPAKTVGMQTALVWTKSPEADFSFVNFNELTSLFD